MRRILLILGSVFLMGAAGPATCSLGSPTIEGIQQATANLCRFLPTASTIANLLASGSTLNTAEAVAKAICDAVAPAPAAASGLRPARALKTPSVNGVPIRGRFLK